MVCTSAGEFFGPAEARREGHLFAERILHFLRHAPPSIGVPKMPGASDITRMPNMRELARDRQRHARDRGLGGGVRGLADLAFEGRDRGGVDDHAALAIGGGRVVLHDGRGGLVAQERADEIDVHDAREEIAGHRAVLAEHAARADDAGAIDQQVDAAHGRARGFHGGVHFGFRGDVALGEAALPPSDGRRGLSRALPARLTR